MRLDLPPIARFAALSISIASCARSASAPTDRVVYPDAISSMSGTRANWLTALDRDHPLVGRIWDCRQGTYVDADTVFRHLRMARLVLLGEKHDNPDHHRLQAGAIGALAVEGRRPAIAFEMFDSEQQVAIDQYRAALSAPAAGLGKATRWDQTGWPAFEVYLPIFEIVFERRLAVVAANLPHAKVRSIARGGEGALGPDLVALGVDRSLPPNLESSLRDELRASHCGHLPDSMLGPMAAAQRARDAQMARTLLEANGGHGAVLIAGAGHVRVDRGVPYYLRQRNPGTAVASVAFLEVARGVEEPRAYANPFGASELPFDFVWFTPRLDDADPCAAFEKKSRLTRTF